ncbi:MAG: DUF134 domain-containing protein [Elusimicrobia bacterium]|nr:DUF134 domain-containing protein [Elusimicrobiota bacterium]
MARPVKCRFVAREPGVTYFKPQGVPSDGLREIVLGFDELEALRLADLEGLYQEDAAARMQVSRPTFGNIIRSAHAKIAQAIINGKALRIEGGICRMRELRVPCWGRRRKSEPPGD